MKTTTRKVRLGMKCGDCLHYTKMAKFEDVCCKLGVKKKANAPDCFHPDFHKLNSHKEPEKVVEISKVVSSLRPSQLRVLAFTLTKTANTLKNYGFYFGQRVYFSLGRDYLSHYFKGYVIGVNSETDTIVVSARLNKNNHSTIGQFLPTSLYDRVSFKKKKRALAKAGRLVMPDTDKLYLSKLPIGELIGPDGSLPAFEEQNFEFDYEPPTLDCAPKEWFDKSQKKGKKKAKKIKSYRPITDLRDIPVKRKNKNYDFDSSDVKL